MTEQEAFDELCGHTLGLHDPEFIHQHVVDTFAAQTADEKTKPIKLTFALVGLYLHLEKNLTGREVQLVHMRLARKKESWPSLPRPCNRGSVRVGDILAAPAGPERARAIDAWCRSVWKAYHESHDSVATLLRVRGIT